MAINMATVAQAHQSDLKATSRWNIFLSVFLCALYISISAALINFNKFLMQKDRFPFAMVMTTCHMITTLTCSCSLYCLAPSLFPSMSKAMQNKAQLIKCFVPLSFLFAVGVVMSNMAYMYCSVPFLQFMKQGNVVLVFFLSCLIGSQSCDRVKLVVVCVVVSGCWLAVTGELHFLLVGFLIQLVSQSAECGKNMAQEWVLSGSDLKLDPLTYNIFMAPACLMVLLVGNVFTYSAEIPAQVLIWWPYLIPNALMAFALNVTIAMLIKTTSAMGFALAGVVKDMVIVTVSCYVFNDKLAPQQMLGFMMATFGIFMWSYVKIQADTPMVMRLRGLVPKSSMIETGNEEETKPLICAKV